MTTIFDGDKVHEIAFPVKGFDSCWEKREWGEKALSDYVAQFHGRVQIYGNNNISGRLTGIKAIINQDKKEIVYALIEPKGRYQKKVLISKTENVLSGATAWDVVEHEIKENKGFTMADALNGLNLARLKEKLPEKAEVLTVVFNRHPKNNTLAIMPVYLDSDPVVNGKSMRMFHLASHVPSLSDGQRWKARVRGNPIVGGSNKQGIPIVHVNVDLLERAV